MMRFELGLEEPAAATAPTVPPSPLLGAYIAGGFDTRCFPTCCSKHTAATAIVLALRPHHVFIALLALAIFGAIKGRLVGTGTGCAAPSRPPLIGGAAATAAYFLARLLNAQG